MVWHRVISTISDLLWEELSGRVQVRGNFNTNKSTLPSVQSPQHPTYWLAENLLESASLGVGLR